MRVLLTCVLLLGLAAAGCVHKTKSKPPGNFEEVRSSPSSTNRRNEVVTQALVLVGRIVSANPTGRFVVISFPLGKMPTTGQRFSVYRQELKVGEIRVTGPQRDDNIVGDITAGSATVGDEIREK